MSLRRSLFVLALALPAIGCHRPHERDVLSAQQKPLSETAVTSQNVVTPSEPGVTNTVPTPAPAPQTDPSPAPQTITPPATAPQTVTVEPPVIVQQAAPAPTPPFAPQVRATINDAGVVVPAVPLYLDPGATPGTPGNGAPDTSTNGQP
jgi:hypothetical protein